MQVHVQVTLPSLGLVHQFTLSAPGQATLVHTLRCPNDSMHRALHPLYRGGTLTLAGTHPETLATVPTALTDATAFVHTTMVCGLSTLEYFYHGNTDATFLLPKILPSIHDHELDNLIPHHAIYESNTLQVVNLYLGLGRVSHQLQNRLRLSPVQNRGACQVVPVQARYTNFPSEYQMRPRTLWTIPITYLFTASPSTALQSLQSLL